MVKYVEFVNSKGDFSISFPSLNGTSDQDRLVAALKKIISPDTITKESDYGWHFSIVHYYFTKDGIQFSVDFDESEIVSMTLKS